MDVFRKLLLPFALIYGLVTAIRNWLYDKQIFKSTSFPIPVIAVGNLSVGGTGKSPQVEHLIRLLSPKYSVAVLSRGYKRSTTGFVMADADSTAETLGDEPYQFHRKFSKITVAVDANRTNGINALIGLRNPDVILLDDAFQHRKVRAGFYILLTAYNDLYADDFILPMGNLRESRRGANRSDIIVVTKCPPDLSSAEIEKIRKKLDPKNHQKIFFTSIAYDDQVYNEAEALPSDEIRHEKKLLLAGIAKPHPFFVHLRREGDTVLEFPDHHPFSEKDIQNIKHKAHGHKIVTTEKDYVRLQNRGLDQLYYLPIKSSFISGGAEFDQTVLDYVSQFG